MFTRSYIKEKISSYEAGRWGSGVVRQKHIQRGDHDLNPHIELPKTSRPAAVLIPLVRHKGGMTVLLTQRASHLKDHAGQISFPGGRFEPSDVGYESTALRETEEEISLSRDRVEVIGRLDTYMTRTGFEVTPVVAFVEPPIRVKPDPREVAAIFEVPLVFLMDRINHKRASRNVCGTTRYFYAMEYREYYIWGATAGMLVNLSELLSPT
ncbi:MAG: CoA pyrophosphatase [Rhodospirillaceae bacterium]|nr:CoA pyrophosphatase [Rhodospirillaceae bacterium]